MQFTGEQGVLWLGWGSPPGPPPGRLVPSERPAAPSKNTCDAVHGRARSPTARVGKPARPAPCAGLGKGGCTNNSQLSGKHSTQGEPLRHKRLAWKCAIGGEPPPTRPWRNISGGEGAKSTTVISQTPATHLLPPLREALYPWEGPI
jgi:hypothetical protein